MSKVHCHAFYHVLPLIALISVSSILRCHKSWNSLKTTSAGVQSVHSFRVDDTAHCRQQNDCMCVCALVAIYHFSLLSVFSGHYDNPFTNFLAILMCYFTNTVPVSNCTMPSWITMKDIMIIICMIVPGDSQSWYNMIMHWCKTVSSKRWWREERQAYYHLGSDPNGQEHSCQENKNFRNFLAVRPRLLGLGTKPGVL